MSVTGAEAEAGTMLFLGGSFQEGGCQFSVIFVCNFYFILNYKTF